MPPMAETSRYATVHITGVDDVHKSSKLLKSAGRLYWTYPAGSTEK